MRSARAVGEFKNHLRAKKKLMETYPSSKGRSSLSKQRALKILIETINAIFENVLSDPTTRNKPLATRSRFGPRTGIPVSGFPPIPGHCISNRQLETSGNRRKPFKIKHITISNRPEKTNSRSLPATSSGTQKARVGQKAASVGMRPWRLRRRRTACATDWLRGIFFRGDTKKVRGSIHD
jgi:hypothetical protein